MEFVNQVVNLNPMGRMAQPYENKSAIQFLCTDAFSCVNGA